MGKNTKWPWNVLNGSKMFEMASPKTRQTNQGHQKCTQIGGLGMKINHLATLIP
jgi:hypothetical protein